MRRPTGSSLAAVASSQRWFTWRNFEVISRNWELEREVKRSMADAGKQGVFSTTISVDNMRRHGSSHRHRTNPRRLQSTRHHRHLDPPAHAGPGRQADAG